MNTFLRRPPSTTTVTNMKFASMAFFTALSFIWYSDAFVVPRLVVSPALSTNKQILSTAPPQHARVTALRDDPKGIVDVVFNSIPLGVLFIAAATERENRKEVFSLQEKALATWKAAQEAAIAAEKESRKEAIAAEKASWENAFLQQKNAIAAEKESRKEEIAAERASRKEDIAAEKESRKEAIAAEKASQDKAIAAERANLLAALSHQNEIWSLRFENYMAKGEKFKKDDGLPPPSSPSDSKSE